MPATSKHRHVNREWRVNIDGREVIGRWKNAYGAIAGGFDRLFGNSGEGKERPDFTDMVIHVECIGGPLDEASAGCHQCKYEAAIARGLEVRMPAAEPDTSNLLVRVMLAELDGPPDLDEIEEQAAIDRWDEP